MTEIEKVIDIEAPPDAVWRVLMDFDAYPEWNPFIPSISGRPEPGETLTVRLEPPGGRGITIKPKVLAVEPGSELRWKGKLLVSGVFDGEHILRIEPAGEGRSRFVHREEFGGVLVSLVKGTLGKTAEGFEQMNAALKQRVEAQA